MPFLFSWLQQQQTTKQTQPQNLCLCSHCALFFISLRTLAMYIFCDPHMCLVLPSICVESLPTLHNKMLFSTQPTPTHTHKALLHTKVSFLPLFLSPPFYLFFLWLNTTYCSTSAFFNFIPFLSHTFTVSTHICSASVFIPQYPSPHPHTHTCLTLFWPFFFLQLLHANSLVNFFQVSPTSRMMKTK